MNKSIKILFILIMLCMAMTFILYSQNHNNAIDFNKNILKYMKEGMDNEEIKGIFEEEIELVEEAIREKLTLLSIQIWYYDVDLNGDGLSDKIVIIRSGLHTGSAGDSFYIILNKGESYCSAAPFSNIELLGVDGKVSEENGSSIYILKDITNGYHDINVKSFDNNLILKFNNEKYEIQKEENGELIVTMKGKQ